MTDHTDRRRKPRRRTIPLTGPVRLTIEDANSPAVVVNAKLIDWNELGVGVETSVAIREKSIVVVKGDCEAIPSRSMRARVVRCSARPDGTFRIGLSFDQFQSSAAKPVGEATDYYELLQVNPRADPETIHRVYRLLAQRFHPDNAETGNADTFRDITKAYKHLGDPEKRAAYDVHLQEYRQYRARIFDPAAVLAGRIAEKHKRRAILELLYNARLNNTAAPSMTIHELEEMLGCPQEHLEFSLWYLKENGWVTRSDNGRYTITARGVDQSEELQEARNAEQQPGMRPALKPARESL